MQDEEAWPGSSPVQIADFILSYVKGSVTIAAGQKLPVVSRFCESLEAFNLRVDAMIRRSFPENIRIANDVLQVYDRLLLTAFVVLRVCREEPTLTPQVLICEQLLLSIASTDMLVLFILGMDKLRNLYARLNDKNFRDRGIREDVRIIHSWVMIMRILDLAQIPRGCFWDVARQYIGQEQDTSSSDARDHERVWEDMFTLLPLVEFNSSGVIQSGSRHDASKDGWAIPQSLLRRVFQLYEANHRQSAGFNDYCRALVGRCYYLVREWGWHKCVSVVGLMFDFFGSQQLAHLRNEEVYQSPRFLENLAGEPILDIEVGDPCFHIFLKLVAVAIRKFRDTDSVKDIRNLVARTMPNHNRQHNKDESVHPRDLAALRNHHDLLCTLFWAAPPELRPATALIQNLVLPATSHKEACLINLHAWTQLVRFILASGQAGKSWKPFHIWRASIFEQVHNQFISVASDVEQQLTLLRRQESVSISKDVVNATIAHNKAVLKDIIYASATASLDAIRCAPDLFSATFAINTAQLRFIFMHFSEAQPELDWRILRRSLETLESMLSKIDDFKTNEESQRSDFQISNSAQADDALLVLDRGLSQSFFRLTRCALSGADDGLLPSFETERLHCVEEIVTLAARITMRFVDGGLMRLSGAFESCKYQLFNGLPHQLDLHQRKYLGLFVKTLLQYDLENPEDAGFSLFEVWLLSLASPWMTLEYGIALGKQLHRRGEAFVSDMVADLTGPPDYDISRALFEHGISSMRQSLGDAGSCRKRTLTKEYSLILKRLMDQVKSDLRTTVAKPAEHSNYVVFIQGIVSLIKIHGSSICVVDDYFYQTSKEYSPSTEDPKLHMANLMSYGLQLHDGDMRISYRLFYLLFNNAKSSIVEEKMRDEIELLRKGMTNRGIKCFILNSMLPAVINAAFQEHDAYMLLDIYTEVFRLYFAGEVVSRELLAEDLTSTCTVLQAIFSI
ncbi:hypothetical protein UVI_02007320 [Ustilaginoidea virens]|uniref:Uncharacterized protein n=1 Tax=Ustilaginoidea virens TaxID=1159556 RepID=A0A1B5KWF3_USTVR|nr:hypothetical protein UVI_02007320 [Ustilaginoidea virens]